VDAEDAGSLRLVVTGRDEDFLNVLVFDLAQGQELAGYNDDNGCFRKL